LLITSKKNVKFQNLRGAVLSSDVHASRDEVFLLLLKNFVFPCQVYYTWTTYRSTVGPQYSFALKLRKLCPTILVSGENCCDHRYYSFGKTANNISDLTPGHVAGWFVNPMVSKNF